MHRARRSRWPWLTHLAGRMARCQLGPTGQWAKRPLHTCKLRFITNAQVHVNHDRMSNMGGAATAMMMSCFRVLAFAWPSRNAGAVCRHPLLAVWPEAGGPVVWRPHCGASEPHRRVLLRAGPGKPFQRLPGQPAGKRRSRGHAEVVPCVQEEVDARTLWWRHSRISACMSKQVHASFY